MGRELKRKGNFLDFRNSLRVTRPDGTIQEICVGRVSKVCSRRKAMEVVSRTLDGAAMLERLNEMAMSLDELRKRADDGDDGAKYDANIQIGLVRSLMDKMSKIGIQTRFVGNRPCFFELA